MAEFSICLLFKSKAIKLQVFHLPHETLSQRSKKSGGGTINGYCLYDGKLILEVLTPLFCVANFDNFIY